jgi:hypothetical protein
LIGNDTPYGTLTVPVTFTVTGVTLTTPNLMRTALPGITIVYSMTLTNGFPINDTFDLVVKGASYPTDLSQATINLADWQAGEFQVLVHVPPGAVSGDQDSITIEAVSQSNPNLKVAVNLVTQVIIRRIYLPFMSKK